MKPRYKKLLSMLLTAAMVFNLGLTPVFAAEGTTPPGVSGVCTHHTDHTADCGYQQGAPCTHEHTDDCYIKELTCKLREGDAPEIATDSEATLNSGTAHTHGDSCYTKTDNCKHTHDDTCGYTPDSPCTYDPASCTQCSPGDRPAEKVCTCEPAISASDAGHDEDCPLYTKPVCTCQPVDSGGQIHGKDCPLYTAPELSEAVKDLIAMVDALPGADTITDENRESVRLTFDAALTAYEALSPEDKAVFEATGQHKKLMALHAVLYSAALLAGGTVTLNISNAADYVSITPTGYKVGAAATETAHTGGYIITGAATATGASGNHVMVSGGGTHNITLKDASIQLSDDYKAAFVVEGNSTVNLTLEGTNVLQSGTTRAGLEVIAGNALTITSASTGSLSATGGAFGAGIGGGSSGAGGEITISGGTVTGTGGNNGAGIGGGHSGLGGSIAISDHAVVFAAKGTGAPNHIGEGKGGGAGTVTRSGGIVFEGTSGLLYGTSVAPTGSFTIPSTHLLKIGLGQTLTINSGITATNNGTIINGGSIGGTITGNQPVSPNLSTHDIGTAPLVLDSACGGGDCTGHTVTGDTSTYKIIVESGAHNVTLNGVKIDVSTAEDVCAFEITGGATVNLTLTGENTLHSGKFRAGLQASTGTTLVITEISTGSLNAVGGEDGAGIGGGKGGAGGTIAIIGGTVTGTGGYNGAGIGGGWNGAGGTIDISGGTVIANGGEYGSGIGSGKDGAGGTIDISGGTVTATGGASGAGIGGGGYQCDSGKIDISGGTVTATGGWNSAGIGGSEDGAGGTITISGGTVTATGHVLSAGIGGGMGGAGGTVTIRENAVVFATGGFGVPDHIGEGLGGSAGTVNRNGGILFEGTEGLLYGTNVTPTANFTIPGTNTLTIATEKTLTMNTGITVTNNGTITNSGTITNNGTLKALGIQSGTGTLTGNGIVQMNLSDSMVTLPQSSYAYTGSPIVPTVTVSPTILWGKSIAFKKDTDYTVTGSNNTVVSEEATVIVTPKGGNSALTGTAVEMTFDITTVNSALALTTNKVGNTVTYGDTITFTANVSIPATKARAASANTVELFCNGTSLGTANLIETGGTGSASFTYDTTGKSIPIGTQTIIAQYGGSGNLNGQTASITVTLNKKAITSAAVNAGQCKDYDGNSNFTGVLLTLNTSDILGGDTVTATANGTMSSKDVGTHSFTCTSVTLGGAHSGYYSLAHSAVTGNVEIKAIAPVYNVAEQKIKINRTLTAIKAAKTAAGVNSETVAGTLTWAESSGGNALSDSYSFTGNAGDTKTLYWTFAPTSGNYNTLSSSTVFTLTEKEVPVLTISNIEKTYDGKAVTTVTGTAKVDSTTVAGTFAFDGTPTMKNAGFYNVTVKFTPNDTESYEIATTSITVTINKAMVGIALNLSKDRITAGEALPTPSIAYSGLVGGESLTPATAPIFAGMPSGSTEGTYTITWSNKTAMQSEIEALPAYQNYTASYKDSLTLTIDKRSGGGTGGGSTGGGGNPTTPSENKLDTKPPVTEDTNAKINSDKDGNVTAKADDKEIAKAIEKAQKADKGSGIAITLNVKTMDDTKSLSVTLSAATMTALTNAKVTQFTINNGLTTLILDLAALKALKGGDVVLTITKADVKTLSAEVQKAIGNRPVFRFGATVGGKAVTDFGGGRVGLQMPYTRSTTEQAGNLMGVYVDGSGKVTWLENSSYDSLTGTLLTSTTHFSVFGVGYKAATAKFTDVGTHWAKNDIDFVVARGLLTGTSNTTFAPDTSMTRGMFVTSFGRLAGVDTKKYQSTKFNDVAATAYYSPYVAWASANNIVNGTSDTTFSPDKAITRQEMAVMLVNYSKEIGYKLPSVHAEVTFTDASSIASWAKDAVKQMQMAGILMGKSGNRFDPTATATRAEVSAMLRRYVELVVNTETAEGWAMNESGQWMYIQDGKRVTGKKTIDGKSYTFDQLGVTTALPPERKYLAYTVQAGDSFWSIARKYKVSMFELAKVNGKTIFSVIHEGDELKVPQK